MHLVPSSQQTFCVKHLKCSRKRHFCKPRSRSLKTGLFEQKSKNGMEDDVDVCCQRQKYVSKYSENLLHHRDNSTPKEHHQSTEVYMAAEKWHLSPKINYGWQSTTGNGSLGKLVHRKHILWNCSLIFFFYDFRENRNQRMCITKDN